MAAQKSSKITTALGVAACVLLGRQSCAFLNSVLSASPQPADEVVYAQRSIHMGCRRVSGSAASLAGGELPSVLASRPARGDVSAHFKITLQTPDGESVIECPEDAKILDVALEEGLELPYSCQSGTCSSCAAQVQSGELDQSEQSFLDDDQMDDEGYCLLCVSFPKSDLTIRTHCEEEL